MNEKLIGKIIFANLLQAPLYKYFHFIDEIENNSLLKSWLRDGLLTKENLSKNSLLFDTPIKRHTAIGKYIKAENKYVMQYYHPYFQFYYKFDDTLWQLFMNKPEKKFLHLIHRVNSRNTITHTLLECIARVQFDFLSSEIKSDSTSTQKNYNLTEDRLKLKVLSQLELVKIIEQNTMNLSLPNICNTRLSRLISNLSISLSNGRTIPLKKLLPSVRDTMKWAMEKLINEENYFLITGAMPSPYSDSKIQKLLNHRFNMITTRRNVTSMRLELGIASMRSRSRDIWCFLTPAFHYYFFLITMNYAIKHLRRLAYMNYLYTKNRFAIKQEVALFFTLAVQKT